MSKLKVLCISAALGAPLIIINIILIAAYDSSSGIRAYESTGLDGKLIDASVAIFGISVVLFAFLASGTNSLKEWLQKRLEKRSKIGDLEEKTETGKLSDKHQKALLSLFNLSSFALFFTAGFSLTSIISGLASVVFHSGLLNSVAIVIQISTFLWSLETLLPIMWIAYLTLKLALTV